MNTILDEMYEPLAAEFQYAQVRLLKSVLSKYGVTGEQAKSICSEFTFSLSVLFDQGEVQHKGETYRPSISFTADEETFIAQPGNLAYHEYAFGTTADIFESEP